MAYVFAASDSENNLRLVRVDSVGSEGRQSADSGALGRLGLEAKAAACTTHQSDFSKHTMPAASAHFLFENDSSGQEIPAEPIDSGDCQ
jgi:hypothetical protein